MKFPAFAYHRAVDAPHAAALLAELGPDAAILAGGQSLFPMMAFRLASPAHLIDINRAEGLDRFSATAHAVEIGALVRHHAFENSLENGPTGALLAAIARHIAHVPIRYRGTFCGSLANADPASEWCAAFVALEGTLQALSRDSGARDIPASQLFEGVMATCLRTDELIVGARLPLLEPGTRWGFNEFSRRAGDYAQALAIALLRIEDGVIVEPRIVLGAAEATPRRIPEAEAALAGATPGPAVFRAAAAAAAAAIDPLEDSQIDGEYRRDLVRAVVRRALEEALR